MRYGFDSIDYKRIYFKYTWISILMAIGIVIFGIIFGVILRFLGISETFISIFPMAIIVLGAIYIMLSCFTALPFVIYISVRNFFQNGHIEIEDGMIIFERACSITGDNVNEKRKVLKYYNIEDITEKSWGYKIKGSLEYYFTSEGSTLKHKKGVFKIPKCFGISSEFRKILMQQVGKKIENNKENIKEERIAFTRKGFCELLIAIIGVIITCFMTNGLGVIIGVTITSWIGIHAINVIREESRDRTISIINIILGIVNFFIVII